jgi:transaldolase/glucose-6-phosphate isomerase
MTMDNKIKQLAELGQSIWYDNIKRDMITSGELQALVDEGLLGMTSNPTIFEKAISGSDGYDADLKKLVAKGARAEQIYDTLTIEDVGMAADVFRSVFDRTQGADGYVSIEVSPKLAHDPQATLDDARRLWKTLKRPNIMVKIPATAEGLPIIEQALFEGININITLMFSMRHYEAVVEAYLRALERRLEAGQPIDHVASVASFFVSRVDTLVDERLEAIVKAEGPNAPIAAALLGKIGVANSQDVYQRFQQIFASDRFKALQAKGARVQRVLWASTSTKNPKYSDTLYVDTLIGPHTVNTVPPETYEAIKDHAMVRRTVDADPNRAHQELADLQSIGIDMLDVGEELSDQGVAKFVKSFDQLLSEINAKCKKLMVEQVGHGSASLGAAQAVVDRSLQIFDREHLAQRIWNHEAGVWSTEPSHVTEIKQRLGWLTVADDMQTHVAELRAFADEIRQAGFKDTVVLGMGGSSLGPDVARITFGSAKGYPKPHVLDTTDPASIRAFEKSIDPLKTLFILSSKSGTTIEVDSFRRYFRSRLQPKVGAAYGRNFVAVTDPGTPLEELAHTENFRHVFVNPPDIGGRYSVLSYFGLVPMALSGIDIQRLLDRAQVMALACAPTVPAANNPGVWLGTIMGELTKAGRDKITFIVSKPIASFGYWVEQLIAESTGKIGKGIVPIEGEAPGAPSVYGDDRFFVMLRLAGDKSLDAKAAALEKAGQPIIRIELADLYDLGGEFFRWELATVVAGAVLQLDPLDQPNVTESKNNTNALLKTYKSNGKLPEGDRVLASDKAALQAAVKNLLDQVKPGDYVALMAYLQNTAAAEKTLQMIRTTVRDRLKVATTIGYGPRFLHSTGQLHKGGANKGVFIQLTADVEPDLPIEGRDYSFATLIRAQALGDLQALNSRHYRVVRIHLGENISRGLKAVQAAVEAALGAKKTAMASKSTKRTAAKKTTRKAATKRSTAKQSAKPKSTKRTTAKQTTTSKRATAGKTTRKR